MILKVNGLSILVSLHMHIIVHIAMQQALAPIICYMVDILSS